MCSPAIIEQVKKRITRRNLLQGIGLAGAASATSCLADQESSNRDAGYDSNQQPGKKKPILEANLKKFPDWQIPDPQDSP